MSIESDDVSHKKRKLSEDDIDSTKKKKKKSKVIESNVDVSLPEKKKKKHKKEKAAVETIITVVNSASEDPVDAAETEKKKKKHKKEKKLEVTESPLPVEKKRRKKEKAIIEDSGVIEGDTTEGAASNADVAEPERKKKKGHKKEKVATDITTTEKPKAPSEATSMNAGLDSEVTAYLQKHNISITPFLYPPILSFSAITPSLPPSLHSAFASFTAPSPIQASTWPPLLEGRDVVGIAETGRLVLHPMVYYIKTIYSSIFSSICYHVLIVKKNQWKNACIWYTRTLQTYQRFASFLRVSQEIIKQEALEEVTFIINDGGGTSDHTRSHARTRHPDARRPHFRPRFVRHGCPLRSTLWWC